MAPMSAVPFQTPQYWDSVMFNMLRSQIEYYFSIENLCKDMYLRKRMDSQGFVPLHFIAAFKRVRELSGDGGMTMVRAACELSTEIDYVVGEDDMERLRRRENWQQWLMNWEDRDEGARTNGPMHVTFKGRGFQFAQQFSGMPPMPYAMNSPPAYPVHGDQQFLQYMSEPQQGHVPHMQNGAAGGHMDVNGASSQLSADVPDFAPSGSAMVGQQAEATSIDTVNPTTNSQASNGAEYGGQGMVNGFHGDGMAAHVFHQQ
jgi:la-related protein 1